MATEYISVSVLRELLSIPPDGDCEKCEHNRWYGCYNDELVRACEAIDDAPEADVVEVVRCKDCQHYNPEATEWRCDMVTGLVEPYDDDFCSYGERRTENG